MTYLTPRNLLGILMLNESSHHLLILRILLGVLYSVLLNSMHSHIRHSLWLTIALNHVIV